MRMYRFIFFAVVVSTMYGMDVKEHAVKMVRAWLELACDSYQGKIGLFYTLPCDVQVNIFSRINPCPFFDDWRFDMAVCLYTIRIPNQIFSFHVLGDHIAYITKSPDDESVYHSHDIQILTGARGECIIYAHDHSNIRICNNLLLIENYKKRVSIVHASVVNTSKVSSFFRFYLTEGEAYTWLPHSSLPLCATIEKKHAIDIVKIHRLSSVTKAECIDVHKTQRKDKMLAWHPVLPFLAIADDNRILIKDQKNQTDHAVVGQFKGKPCFSYDQNTVFIQHPKGLFKYEISKRDNAIIPIEDNEKSMLCSVGIDYFLMKKKGADDACDTYGMRSFHNPSELTLMTSFGNNKGKGLCQLPSNADPRYITIESKVDVDDSSKIHSDISICMPQTNACLQHYCLMQAALVADTVKHTFDWELFKEQKYTLLVSETAEYYALFKKMMIDHKILH